MHAVRYLLVAALSALVSVSAPAQEQPDAAAHAPKLVCDEPAFDFGTMDNSQAVEHTFVLRNEGDLTLEITQVRPSCGCTVASISERSVPPGGESRVTARLSLAGRTGPQHKAIVVESNDPQKPQFTLSLAGVAGVALDVQPPRVILGQVPAGTKPSASIQVTGSGTTPFSVASVAANTEQLVATIETLEEGRVYKVNLEAREALSPGQFDAVVVIRTDHPQRPSIEVPVTFVVVGEVIVAPRELEFPAVSTEPVTRYVIIRADAANPFQIERVETPDPSISVVIEPFGAGGYKVQLNNVVASPALDGAIVKIHTTLAGTPEIDVPLRIQQAQPAPGT